MAQVQGEIEPFPVSTEPALKERLAELRLCSLGTPITQNPINR